MTDYTIITEHTHMRPDDLLEYRCPRFGIVTQWRVVAVKLGAEYVQSIIEVIPVTKKAPKEIPAPFSVPEQMTRNLTVIRRGKPQ